MHVPVQELSEKSEGEQEAVVKEAVVKSWKIWVCVGIESVTTDLVPFCHSKCQYCSFPWKEAIQLGLGSMKKACGFHFFLSIFQNLKEFRGSKASHKYLKKHCYSL